MPKNVTSEGGALRPEDASALLHDIRQGSTEECDRAVKRAEAYVKDGVLPLKEVLEVLQDKEDSVLVRLATDELNRYVANGESSTEGCYKALASAKEIFGEGALNKAVAEGILLRDQVGDDESRKELFGKGVSQSMNFLIRYVRLPKEELDRLLELAKVCVEKEIIAQETVDAAKAAREEKGPCLSWSWSKSLRQ
jgi:hypothetical protein